jgi:hypothetical protein
LCTFLKLRTKREVKENKPKLLQVIKEHKLKIVEELKRRAACNPKVYKWKIQELGPLLTNINRLAEPDCPWPRQVTVTIPHSFSQNSFFKEFSFIDTKGIGGSQKNIKDANSLIPSRFVLDYSCIFVVVVPWSQEDLADDVTLKILKSDAENYLRNRSIVVVSANENDYAQQTDELGEKCELKDAFATIHSHIKTYLYKTKLSSIF